MDEIFRPLEEIKTELFISYSVVDLSKELDRITEQLNSLSPEIKDHDIILNKKQLILGLKRKHRLIRDIKSDCIKPSHLTQIMNTLKMTKNVQDIQL